MTDTIESLQKRLRTINAILLDDVTNSSLNQTLRDEASNVILRINLLRIAQDDGMTEHNSTRKENAE